ncbi:MAG: hypothetical protein ACO1N0_09160 [Fluviicola sp.]
MELFVYIILTGLFSVPVFFLWRILKASKYRKYWFMLSMLGYNYLFFFILLFSVELTGFGTATFLHDCLHKFWLIYLFYVIICDFIIPVAMILFFVLAWFRKRNGLDQAAKHT